MKTNIFSRIALAGATALLGATSMVSCADQNDWDVDKSYDRLFHSTRLSVATYETKVGVNFDMKPGTTACVVECCTDTLYDEIEQGAIAGSIVDTLTVTPDTIYNLQASTKYYMRMRSINNEGKSSKWIYLDGYTFTTKAEQIITGVNPKSTSAVATFAKGAVFTNAWVLHVSNGVTDSVAVAFTDADVAAGEITIPDLKANSNYTFKLYNGEKLRGSYKFRTTEAFPDNYEVLTLSANVEIKDLLASTTAEDVVVVFPDGMEYNDGDKLEIPANIKNIYFWGAEGDNTPTYTLPEVNLNGNIGIVRFYNLNLKNLAGENTSGYVANIDGAVSVGSIEIDKCSVETFRGVVRLQKFTGAVGSILINNCTISGIGSYGIVNTKSQPDGSLGSIEMTNSTVNGVTGSPLFNVQQNNLNITVDHCTFYNCSMTADKKQPLVNGNSTNIVPVISNSLFGWSSEVAGKAISTKTVSAADVYYTSEVKWDKNYELGEAIDAPSTDLWTDAANGDFSITISYENKYSQFGDPRWVKQ